VHELYSLRWQIELLFKIWKSTFAIDKVKPVNVQRLKCHVYSKLIVIWLLSTTMFKMRELLYEKAQKELSEQKAMSVLVPFLPDLFPAIQADGILLRNLLGEIFRFLEQNRKKSRRKGKKTSLDILVAISLG
ncbi:transposase, partial [Enterococcus sp. CWB-B31]|uniref:transposase n=1 Tax=Enterococcus sp. CWB-B31 TaxID=2885159 RepID=UPI001E3037A7